MMKLKLMIAGLMTTGFAFALAMPATAQPGGNRLDKDGDGVITEKELDARKSRLMEADTNNDGQITREEMRAYREARRAERNPDKNGDGVVSREEFTAAADERFDRLDKNGDGVLTEDELPRRRGKNRRHRRGDRSGS